MKIDRTNYEIWFIDWLDGNLTEAQIEQLNLFLSHNPDLREEFDDICTDTTHRGQDKKTFPQKDQLKKSMKEIPADQFEFLCVAHLENDLTEDQKNELYEIIEQDADRKRTFELIQKTRLSLSAVTFKHKNLLLKKTFAQKVIRMSVIGLSAAAVILMIIVTQLKNPRSLSLPVNRAAQNIVTSRVTAKPSPANVIAKIPERNKTGNVTLKKGTGQAKTLKENPLTGKAEPALSVQKDTLVRSNAIPELITEKIVFNKDINIDRAFITNSLVASDINFSLPPSDDGRSNIGRFLAKTIRIKILKEKTTRDAPLRAYEVAEAGVAGLNKLLGWEMALTEKNDEAGNLKSVYFSSRILKFNAPVKKSEPLP
jgi:hypothetical protein